MTLAEQRLNSNHGRLVRAARAVAPRLWHVPIEGWGWTPRDILAHVLAWQEEALRRFEEPHVRCLPREEVDLWNAAAHGRMQDLRWDDILLRIEAAHQGLKPYLTDEPPSWFAACTYRHYTEHTRALLQLAQSGSPRNRRFRGVSQSPTTTVVPIAAQL